MRHFLTLFLTLTGFWGNSQNQPAHIGSQNNTSNATVTTKLNVPFGTIVKLEVEIYDGDSLQMKEYQEAYLLKINSVNDKQQIDTLLMTFEDETEELANDNFQLYKLIYGKAAKSLSSKQIDKMKKNYVGKKLTLMAYETGHFTGMPKDYFKYRPISAGRSFYFQNYLVIVSNLTK
jgi:hypothetical protein